MDDIKISLDTTGSNNDISIIRVDGVIDTMTASELERVMNSLIEQKRYRIIIDLAGVDYISSAGWGIFISNIREIKANAGDIKLARMIPSVYEIFELLEFDSILKAYDNIEKAKIEFRGAGEPTESAAEVRVHNQKEAASASVSRQVEVATAPEVAVEKPKAKSAVRSNVAQPTKATPAAAPIPAPIPEPVVAQAVEPLTDGAPKMSVEKTVLSLVKADPFYTIRELAQMVNSESNGSGHQVGWWRVWSILRRNSLLSRKKRFRYSRRA